MHITMVKKIKADGSPCRKCQEVEDRLVEAQLRDKIDKTVIADERDPASEGMLLAAQYEVVQAPFFLVTGSNGQTEVYVSYYRFLHEVLHKKASEQDEIKEIMEQNNNLDFL